MVLPNQHILQRAQKSTQFQRGTLLHLVTQRIRVLLIHTSYLLLACNLRLNMKLKKRPKSCATMKEFFTTDITYFVVIKPWTFEKKHIFVKVSTQPYIILQLRWFPIDTSSCFTHLSQKLSSSSRPSGCCWNVFSFVGRKTLRRLFICTQAKPTDFCITASQYEFHKAKF